MIVTLDELEVLTPPDDYPDDARVVISARDLRALVGLIPCAREHQAVFGTHKVPRFEEPQHAAD